ncbi:MAG TPA: serine hydrolase [Streptosporangiaceae bacterium]|nr:serine hydrolase [Streptosporangiaceae bacterium]
MKRAPSHAGRLPVWERLVFAMVFALMVAFVVAVTVSATKLGNFDAPGGARPALQPLAGRIQAVVGGASGQLSTAGQGRRAQLDRRLAAALAPVLRGRPGHLAVGVIDTATGAEAVYGANRHFHTASIVKADILAAALLQSQQQGAALTDAEADLAVSMIEDSDNADATSLWNLLGGGSAIAAANLTLGLSHTIMGPSSYWGLTSTTVVDQLRLLTDLTSSSSPLSSASQDYELGLMENVEPGQQWGVSAAARPGSTYAIKDGWLPDPALWVVDSIGVVRHDGQQLLIAVLSDGQPTEADGIAVDSAAAVAAARVITSVR